MSRIEDNRLIKKHIKKAKASGKCEQCQRPWHDGICSCGKSGLDEDSIAKIAYQLLEEEERHECEDDSDQDNQELIKEAKREDRRMFSANKMQGFSK